MCMKNKMNEVYCRVLSRRRHKTLQGYKTPFKCVCVVTSVLPQSGSGVSSAGSEGAVFCV